MSESFEQLLESESKTTIKNGEVVTGKVLTVKDDEIQLNIGYKHDGIIAKNEFSDDPNAVLTDLVKVGDELEAKVLKVNDGDGMVLLSTRRLKSERVSETLQKAFDEGTVLTGAVEEVVKGGVTLTIDETKIFIPASLFSDTFQRDLSKYVGQEIRFRLTEFNPRKRRVIGDRKTLLVEEKKAAAEELLSRIHVGDKVEGTVKNLTDFGAFIDLGGVDGLLHISEIGWGRIQSPKKVFKTGDKVTVMIKDIANDRIALTGKFPEENPWADVETKFAVGNVVKGKVARLTDFGAFVELAKDVDGLLHVSQIQYGRVNSPADVLSEGQEIEAKVIALDMDNHKISLSMKELLPKPERKPRNERKVEENADEAVVDIDAYIRKSAEEPEAEEGETNKED